VVNTIGTPGGGTVRISCSNTSSAPVTTGVVVLTVSLPVPITNTQSFPSVPTGIRVTNGTNAFLSSNATSGAAAVAGANVGISSVNNAAGQVVIGLGTNGGAGTSSGAPANNPTVGITFPAATGCTTTNGVTTCTTPNTSTFDLQGVLVSTNGKTGPISATLSSSGGVNIGTGSAEVIAAVTPGLTDPTAPTTGLTATVTGVYGAGGPTVRGGAAVLSSNGAAVNSTFVIRVAEAYPDMFKSAAQFNAGGVFPVSTSASTQVNIRLNNIPAGLSISNCAAVMTDPNGAALAAGTPGTPILAQSNVTAASPILNVQFAGALDQTTIDVLWVTCQVGAGTATLPLPSAAVTAQVELAPEGTALCTLGVPSATGTTACTGLTTGNVPRYQPAYQPTTPITVIVFPPSQTTLLLPLASVGPGYNTGIAISNTSTDPFTPAGGGATPSDGTIVFTMYKNDGTSKTYTTTTGSPGNGLTAGVVKSGATYLVNLSELLSAASFGTTFNGYVFVAANFPNAHGAATIYVTTDGSAALSTPVLVLPAISSAAPRTTPESLGQ